MEICTNTKAEASQLSGELAAGEFRKVDEKKRNQKFMSSFACGRYACLLNEFIVIRFWLLIYWFKV